MLRGTQISYMPDKSHLSIIIINTQGQMVQIRLVREKCLKQICTMKLWFGRLLLQQSAKQKSNKIPFVYNKSQM